MNLFNYRPRGTVRRCCPECDSRVMERVSDGRALNVGVYLMFALLTCGFGLLMPFVCTRPKYALYCPKCDHIQGDR